MNETPETIRRPDRLQPLGGGDITEGKQEVSLEEYFRRVQSAHDGVLHETDGELASGEAEFGLDRSEIEAARIETGVDTALQGNAGKLKALRDKTLAALKKAKEVVTSEEFSQIANAVPIAGSAKLVGEAVMGKTLSGKKLTGGDRAKQGFEGLASGVADAAGIGVIAKAAKVGKAAWKAGEVGKVKVAGKMILKEGGEMVKRGKKRQEVARGQGEAKHIESDQSEAGVQEREEYIARRFEEGLNNPDIAAYHGCSLEVLKYLIEHGHIPGSTTSSEKAEKTGIREIFAFPIDQKTTHNPRVGFSDNHALEGSWSYATVAARDDAFYEALGLHRFDVDQLRESGLTSGPDDNLDDKDIIKGLERIGIKKTIQDVQRAREAARVIQDGGVVLGLSKDMLKNLPHRTTEGGGEDGEIIVEIREGLDYRYIVGVEPCDQKSFDFLMALQKKSQDRTQS